MNEQDKIISNLRTKLHETQALVWEARRETEAVRKWAAIWKRTARNWRNYSDAQTYALNRLTKDSDRLQRDLDDAREQIAEYLNSISILEQTVNDNEELLGEDKVMLDEARDEIKRLRRELDDARSKLRELEY